MRHIVNLGLNIGAPVLFVLSSLLVGCSLADAPTRDRPSVKYDPVSGRLKELAFDTTQNGRNDSVGYMDGTRVQRIEVDEDEDGKVDRWEFYDANHRLERAGFSRQRNGILDAMAFYAENGDLERIEMSTNGDGLFNRVEFYRLESLARVEEDTNGDGRIDKWEAYAVDPHGTPAQSPAIVTVSFDDSFRGTPTRRLMYRPDGTGILRIEVDPDGDGTFEELTTTRRGQRD